MVPLYEQLVTMVRPILLPTTFAILMSTQPTPTPKIVHQSEIVSIFTTPSVTPTPTSTPSPTPSPTPKPTETPIPTPTRMVASAGDLDSWFTRYADEYHIDRQKLWNIAVCESGLRNDATNGDYLGLYQFATSTWQVNRTRMGADTSPDLRRNPEESIKTAAFKMSRDGYGAWPNCGA